MRSSIRDRQPKWMVLHCAALAMLASSGCSLCSPGFMDDYATVGGKWTRNNPTEGRVGSPMSDPFAGVGNLDAIAPLPPRSTGGVSQTIVEEYDPSLDSGIEIVPEYESGSIILGDDW